MDAEKSQLIEDQISTQQTEPVASVASTETAPTPKALPDSVLSSRKQQDLETTQPTTPAQVSSTTTSGIPLQQQRTVADIPTLHTLPQTPAFPLTTLTQTAIALPLTLTTPTAAAIEDKPAAIYSKVYRLPSGTQGESTSAPVKSSPGLAQTLLAAAAIDVITKPLSKPKTTIPTKPAHAAVDRSSLPKALPEAPTTLTKQKGAEKLQLVEDQTSTQQTEPVAFVPSTEATPTPKALPDSVLSSRKQQDLETTQPPTSAQVSSTITTGIPLQQQRTVADIPTLHTLPQTSALPLTALPQTAIALPLLTTLTTDAIEDKPAAIYSKVYRLPSGTQGESTSAPVKSSPGLAQTLLAAAAIAVVTKPLSKPRTTIPIKPIPTPDSSHTEPSTQQTEPVAFVPSTEATPTHKALP